MTASAGITIGDTSLVRAKNSAYLTRLVLPEPGSPTTKAFQERSTALCSAASSVFRFTNNFASLRLSNSGRLLNVTGLTILSVSYVSKLFLRVAQQSYRNLL